MGTQVSLVCDRTGVRYTLIDPPANFRRVRHLWKPVGDPADDVFMVGVGVPDRDGWLTSFPLGIYRAV